MNGSRVQEIEHLVEKLAKCKKLTDVEVASEGKLTAYSFAILIQRRIARVVLGNSVLVLEELEDVDLRNMLDRACHEQHNWPDTLFIKLSEEQMDEVIRCIKRLLAMTLEK